MENYNYTNKLLKALAICNLWAFIPMIWGTRWGLKLIFAGVGDHTPMVMTLLFNAIQGYAILIFTTWTFLFRRWYWVVVLYVMYLSYRIPIAIVALVQYWERSENLTYLGSSLSIYTDIFTWLLGIITIIVMLSETPYRRLFKRWRSIFQKIKTNFSVSLRFF